MVNFKNDIPYILTVTSTDDKDSQNRIAVVTLTRRIQGIPMLKMRIRIRIRIRIYKD